MNENFNSISKSFEDAGVSVATAEFSITEYSLNTDLSFKFNNVDELLLFLDLKANPKAAKVEQINTMLVEAGVNPDSFFYVNFYKPTVAEL